MDSNKLLEGLEQNDLSKLVKPRVTIDEYKSKMGDDADICVLCFTVQGKEPALDLASFIEKGCEWVLDADVSSGEIEDGNFLVFVETERDETLAENICRLLSDMMNLTDQNLDEWVALYPKTKEDGPITIKSLQKLIPLSPEEYQQRVGIEDDVEDEPQLESLRAAAGLNSKVLAPKNSLTDSIRFAAGLNINDR